MKICKDCISIRYVKPHPDSHTYSSLLCGSYKYEKQVSLITGEAELVSCEIMRGNELLCGKDGRLYMDKDV